MADAPGYLIGPKLLAQIQSTVRHYAQMYGGGEAGRTRQQGQQNRQAILQSDLLAAVNTLTDRSTALAEVLQRKTNGDLETTGQVVTVVNPFQEISIDAGTYIKIEWIDGEWQPYAADCPAQSASMSMSMSGSASESASTPPPPPGGP